MDPSTGHHQEMSQHSLENMLGFSKTQQQQGERKPKPQPEQALNCPRCDSTNTKFCYYNNYSLTQPRYFCKSCRRYWTKGGTLRNVPVGGGCRKNKRCSSSSSSSSKRSQDQQPLTPNNYNNTNSLLTTFPQHYYDSNDLRLAFSGLQKQSCGQLGFDDHDFSLLGNSSNTYSAITNNCATTHPGFLDALRNGFIESHNNFQNLNYGFGNGNVGSEVENSTSSACGVSGEMGLPIYDQEIRNVATTSNAVTVTTMKQEICNGRSESNENKVLWGFPWQLNGEANMGHHDFDNGRDQSWNGTIASSWHGLLNTTPLM